ncbi:hypothetical protein D3C84_731510 [compost metagenome]
MLVARRRFTIAPARGTHQIHGKDEACRYQRQQTEHAEHCNERDAADLAADIGEQRQADGEQEHGNAEPLNGLCPAKQCRMANYLQVPLGLVLFRHGHFLRVAYKTQSSKALAMKTSRSRPAAQRCALPRVVGIY